jgi:hypothetical protein
VQDEYTFFSSDLSRAIAEPYGDALYSPEATEQTPYVRDTETGSYLPLVTANDVVPGVKFGEPRSPEDPKVIAVTQDFSHILFRSRFALTSNAVEAGSGNLYEWSGGRLQLVNVLPDGTASEGAFLGGSNGKETRNAFSGDGSHVFFQIGLFGEAALDERDTVTGQTVEVDAPAPGVSQPPANKASFQIASVDGSKVFFLDEEPLTLDSKLPPVLPGEDNYQGDLYVYETGADSLTDLTVDQNTGEEAEVRTVVGTSEDGSIVYFEATGKLAEGAESGQRNLYVESETGSSWSAPRLVAVVGANYTYRVSPDGRYLAFMSDRSLTGYDNHDVVSGAPDEEVYLYDEATGGLSCVSCNPTGARPDGVYDHPGEGTNKILVDAYGVWQGFWLAGSIPGRTEPESNIGYSVSYQSRVLSDEGRMFFDAADALVPQATNGREDVYEYEPVGVGGSSGCTRAARTYVASEGGCVSLISAGTSSEESEFLDASETGNDVFFLTQAKLVPQDIDSSLDVYDAHLCQESAPCVSVPVSPPPCSSGDACKPAPSLQPAIFGAPASATFSGTGNITQATPEVVKAKPKSKPVKCRKGFARRDGRCVRSRTGRKKTRAKRKAGEKRGARS